MDFGTRIKNRREDLDLTQKEVAEKIPMNQSNYSKIERGVQEPSINQLIKISEILNTSVDDLLGIDNTDYTINAIETFQRDLDKLFDKYFGNGKNKK